MCKGARKENFFLGVAGNPVVHSKSPEIFKKFFSLTETEGSYLKVNSKSAKQTVEIFKQLEFSGMNITAPLKTKIIPYIDSISQDAEGSDAVNLIVNDKGIIKGYNTDHFGVVNSLGTAGIRLEGLKAVVLGTGGAARGAVYGLSKSGVKVAVSGRDKEAGLYFKKKFNIDFIEKGNLRKIIPDFDIVVNTIPVKWDFFDIGVMKNNSVFLNADYSGKVVYEKDILKQRGIIFLTGYEWLYYQALLSFEILRSHFFPKITFSPDNKAINKSIRTNSGDERDRIFFIGFSGSGKTTLGKIAAKRIGYDFIDTDSLIEERASMKIKDIFHRYGEEYFRKLESKALLEISKRKKILVSGGGGISISERNRNLIKKNFFVIWIFRDMETVLKTADDSARPLMHGKTFMELIELFKSRLKYYHAVSDFLICNEVVGSDTLLFNLLNGLCK